jgi:hypothetical protein
MQPACLCNLPGLFGGSLRRVSIASVGLVLKTACHTQARNPLDMTKLFFFHQTKAALCQQWSYYRSVYPIHQLRFQTPCFPIALRKDPSITKKNYDFFVYFGTHNNKIHTIYKQTSVFVVIFFIVDILVLLAKQQQQKSVNLYTISVCYA